MKEDRAYVTLDQLSKMIAGDGQVTRWRVNAPSHAPSPPRRRSPPGRRRGQEPFIKPGREATAWRVARWIVLGSLALSAAVGWAAGLDPSRPPGGNFDLSHWKLTLPDTNATEIEATELMAGYSNATYFYTGPDGAMTFWCPVTGGETGDEAFPRCELRELMDPDNLNQNWTGFGTNTLNARCKVTKVPSNKTVVVGQIHSFTGLAPPLIKLQYNDGIVEALVKEVYGSSVDTRWPFGTIGLNQPFDYQVDLTEGRLTVTVNGSNQTANVFAVDPAWTNQTFFFKAGNYCQDDSGSATEGSIVAFYSLAALHIGPVSSGPTILLENLRFAPNGQFTFTLVGPGPGSYFIQGSADLINWTFLLITNSISGRVEFEDPTSAEPGSSRFYRGGSF
jgi:hypothetical protein